jgi:hypothetical protein
MIRCLAAFLTFAFACSTGAGAAPPAFTVDANVALSSLISLSDNHMATLEDTLETLASTPAAASGDWSLIEPSLRKVGSINVAAILYYANTNGVYWTITTGKQPTTIADRPYFIRAMQGKSTVGDLLESRSTGKPVAVVAVPVMKDGKVTGMLGGSIFLDQLSLLLVSEMRIHSGMLFWALDPHGTIALHSDTSNVFVKPGTTPALKAVTKRMLADRAGTETYSYKGQTRTVVFRKSGLTGWTYGFGIAR